MSTNRIPYNFTARPYQVPFLREVEKAINGKSDKQFFMQIWHRRSGKDKTNIADVAPRRLIHSPGLVKYVYPTLVMGRDNLFTGIGSDGFRYLDHIPEFIRIGQPNESRMVVSVKNNTSTSSIFQVAGSDNPDSLRGGNPIMFIFSEWSEQDPYAWDVVEPILRENKGIAIFNLTPRGDNHARSMYDYARNNNKWYTELLTAKDTGVWTDRELEDIRLDIIKRYASDGRSESEANAYFDQEYMCSFKAPVIGAYYGSNIQQAEAEGRITSVPVDQATVVNTAWDLGVNDSMAIWFFQVVGQEFHFIDYYESSGEGLGHYAKVLQDKGYIYGQHFAPHDIAVRELGTGKSRLETARGLGINFNQGAKLDIIDGIDATRGMFNRFWFDKDKCMRGLNCLKNYCKEWDEKNKVFKNKPKHDWTSNGADALRTMSINYKPMRVWRPRDVGGIKPYIEGIG